MKTFKKVIAAIWKVIKAIAKGIKILLWPLRKGYDWVVGKLTFTKVANITPISNLIFTGGADRFFFIPTPYIATSSSGLYTTKSYRIGFLIFQLMLDVCNKAEAAPIPAPTLMDRAISIKANGSTYTVKKAAAPAVKKAAPKAAVKKTAAKKK